MQEMWLSGYIGTKFGIWKLILVQTLIQTVSFFHSPPSLSHASMCECAHACVHARVPASVRTCVCVCVCMHVCMWVSVSACMCMCVCVRACTYMHASYVSECMCVYFVFWFYLKPEGSSCHLLFQCLWTVNWWEFNLQ